MPLTRSFKETVQARARCDVEFRVELFRSALECMLEGDFETGKRLLRDYINATVGFDDLAKHLAKNPKSVMRMLGPSGNPRAENLFGIINHLREKEGVRFELTAS